ncbi:MAG: DUF4846 domain-containing protein [Clostridium sp.]|nr:DUF4846 domain-containing protein [Clostridium sp.]
MKRKVKIIVALTAALFISACQGKALAVQDRESVTEEPLEMSRTEEIKIFSDSAEHIWIHPQGNTVGERIEVPEGYVRVEYGQGSFGAFVRNYPLKADGSPVVYYNGDEKQTDNHVAVFDMYLGPRDLQQCADSVMRMIAEYYYALGDFDRIHFAFVNGFDCRYDRWRQGQRVKIDGDLVSWTGGGTPGDSQESFEQYLTTVFAYASTLSMERDGTSSEAADIKTGDVFIKGGSPGHVVMVADVCEDSQGKKAFLLAQGYMPAQSFHVLKNPHREEPWYYEEDMAYPFVTPEYTFPEGSLKRLGVLN